MNRLALPGCVALLATFAACDLSPRGVEGRWVAQDAERWAIEFRGDSTFVMVTGSFTGTGTYDVDEERRVVLEPTGDLAAVVPAGYSGVFAGDTLNVCAPSGLCTNFYRE
jgi:hypothetical protein